MVSKVGKLDHLESGHVIAHALDNIVIVLQNLTFELEFEENLDVKESKLEATGGGMSLKLKFVNYNSGLGTVNTVPLPIGSLNNRKLYLNYAIYSFGASESPVAKLVHYTFLLGENV